MDAIVTRNFTVKGTVEGMFTPDGGDPTVKYVANLRVELWHKGPMEVIFLGDGLTGANGEYTISFEYESPSPIITDGEIKDIFIKVYYGNVILIGDPDPLGGSFD